MNPPAYLGHGDGGPHRHRWLRLLAVVFSIATVGSLLLVATDLVIGRSPAGDLFIAGLNALTAAVLWRVVPKHSHT